MTAPYEFSRSHLGILSTTSSRDQKTVSGGTWHVMIKGNINESSYMDMGIELSLMLMMMMTNHLRSICHDESFVLLLIS